MAELLLKTRIAMPHDNAAHVIDLQEYRRRRQAKSEAQTPRAQVAWVPTMWGYWVPVWTMR